MDTSKLLDIVSPFTTRTMKDKKEHSNKVYNKENRTPPSRAGGKAVNSSIRTPQGSASALPPKARHSRSRSLPKSELSEVQGQRNTSATKPQGLKPLVFAPLAPIKGSTTSSVNFSPAVRFAASTGKENTATNSPSKQQLTRVASSSRTRKLTGPRKAPVTPDREKRTKIHNNGRNVDIEKGASTKPMETPIKRGRVLADISTNNNMSIPLGSETRADTSAIYSSIGRGSVKERWLDWERERERLREMDRVEEDKVEENLKEVEGEKKIRKQDELEVEHAIETETTDGRVDEVEERDRRVEPSAVTTPHQPERNPAPMVNDSEMGMVLKNGLPRPRIESGLNVLKQSLMTSIEKGVQLYKASTLAHVARQSAKAITSDDSDESRRDTSMQESWEDESLIREANSSLPAVRHAVRNERLAQDNNLDRMSLWVQNVEKVVADARRDFAAAPLASAPVSPLPVAPCRRHSSQRRTQRIPRKILAAREIFNESGDTGSTADDRTNSHCSAPNSSLTMSDRSLQPSASEPNSHVPLSPPRTRRATVGDFSSETTSKDKDALRPDTGSSSKRAEKSKSQSDLLAQPITPIQKLEMELEKLPAPAPPLRLSAVVDRSLFVATPKADKMMIDDDLDSAPDFVEPFPSRIISNSRSLDSPSTKRHVESSYERLITSTSGVMKVGLGYQSNLKGAVAHTTSPDARVSASKRNHVLFTATRRGMPSPVSSEDWRKTVSVDELGIIVTPSTSDRGTELSRSGNDRSGTVSAVRRAFKMMAGKTVSKRSSRMIS